MTVSCAIGRRRCLMRKTLNWEDMITGGLPNAKELQSIVDYTRSPQSTGTPAIDPLFECTEISDPDGNPGQYPYFWTGTTHKDGVEPYNSAVYIAFGEAQGEMNGKLMDVHGAGSQRSDPKSGDPGAYPQFFGPQGDVRYVYNAVRCVRDIKAAAVCSEATVDQIRVYPNPVSNLCSIESRMEGEEYDLKLCDSLGRVIFEKRDIVDNTVAINLKDHSEGLYLLSLISGEKTKTIKIIKK